MMIKTQRVYDGKPEVKGYRVLIDRVWPRGLKKEEVHADVWLKDVAPSTELRKWFNHDPEKWPEFKKRYFRELRSHPDAVERVEERAREGDVVLLYGSHEERYNNAAALKEFLESRLEG